MIKSNTIGVGDKFQLITITKNKHTDVCLLNGHLAAYKPECVINATKGLEFEVTRKRKKIKIYEDGPNASYLFYLEIKPIGQDVVYEMLDKDLNHRCERIAPPYAAIKYVLHEVHPRIFCAVFENDFDMAMTFLRYQEYYESSSADFKGKPFTIIDYMRWYANNLGKGSFTYTSDWGGFNIPSKIVTKMHEPGFIKDWNCYDEEMKRLYKTARQASEDQSFYLIAMSKGDSDTLRHEVAHGLFCTAPSYRDVMSQWVKQYLPAPIRDELTKILKEMGYDESVIIDEIQAYCSTGLTSRMQSVPGIDKCNEIQHMRKSFEDHTTTILFDLE